LAGLFDPPDKPQEKKEHIYIAEEDEQQELIADGVT
jgi:hypothetical protein